MLWNLHEFMPCMTICGWLVFKHLLRNCTLISLCTKLVLVPDLSGAVSSCWVPGYIVVVLYELYELKAMSSYVHVKFRLHCSCTVWAKNNHELPVTSLGIGQVSSKSRITLPHYSSNEGSFCNYRQEWKCMHCICLYKLSSHTVQAKSNYEPRLQVGRSG